MLWAILFGPTMHIAPCEFVFVKPIFDLNSSNKEQMSLKTLMDCLPAIGLHHLIQLQRHLFFGTYPQQTCAQE